MPTTQWQRDNNSDLRKQPEKKIARKLDPVCISCVWCLCKKQQQQPHVIEKIEERVCWSITMMASIAAWVFFWIFVLLRLVWFRHDCWIYIEAIIQNKNGWGKGRIQHTNALSYCIIRTVWSIAMSLWLWLYNYMTMMIVSFLSDCIC